jgi:hypothetical protein
MVVKSMSVFGSMKYMAAVAAHWGVPLSEKNVYSSKILVSHHTSKIKSFE